MERILVAMSGGVDSSVAALLLQQQGFAVVGAYMKNWINEDHVLGRCPWQQDIDDARAVADRLGLEFRVVNLMGDYRRLVVDYLLDGYQRGLTPNPDVMCNREVKFGVFRAYAKAEGFAAVATGHYARRVAVRAQSCCALGTVPETTQAQQACALTNDMTRAAERWSSMSPSTTGAGRDTGAHPNAARRAPVGAHLGAPNPEAQQVCAPTTYSLREGDPPPVGRALRPTVGDKSRPTDPTFALLEGADKNKDQSYFLALLSQEQLRDARFPIGHLAKPELRRLAREAGLPTADKKDSQGICFIGEVKMADFLRAYVPEKPGPIVRATDGAEIGRHRGLHYYTIGQRKGIGIPSNTDFKNYVVVGKRAADHALLVAFDGPDAPGLWTTGARVHSLSFIGQPLTAPGRVDCRVRYRDPRVPVEFIPDVGRSAGQQSDRPPSSATVRFAEPQRALAAGQILALYDGERLLGGGVFV